MKYVVSANYRDRKSPYKWLVRRMNENPEQAVPCRGVKMNGVVFGPSNAYEEGFGCKTVAICDDVSISEPFYNNTDLPASSIPTHNSGEYLNLGFDGEHICRMVPLEEGTILPTVVLDYQMRGWLPEQLTEVGSPAPADPEFATA